MKERQKQQNPPISSTQPLRSLSLFVSNNRACRKKVQITVELSSDELEHPQLTDTLAGLDTDQDCACE